MCCERPIAVVLALLCLIAPGAFAAERADTILREHEGGWNGCLDSLARHIETDTKEDPS